jgi:type VI protein secretion system component Hcp
VRHPLPFHLSLERNRRTSWRHGQIEALEDRTLLSQVDYYLNIPGIVGNSTAVGHKAAIDVSSTSWDTMRPADFLAGAAAFAPLFVDSTISQASPTLFEASAAGTKYAEATLTAATSIGGAQQDFANWTLSNVVIASYHTVDGAERYSLDYTKADLSYAPTLPGGELGSPVDASWDLAAQGGSMTTAADLTPAGPGVTASYFLAIPGISGGSAAQAHLGAIDVGSMSWGVTAGSVAGNASFAPLVVDSSISQASPLLFQAAAAGTVYPSVSLTAATSINGTLSDFAKWTLSNAVFTSYRTADGAERYALDYTKADMSYTPRSSTGQPGAPVDASWDLAAQGGTMTTAADLNPAGPPLATSYYLAIPGIAGGATAQGHVGAVNILSMSWGVTAGPGPGEPSFQPLVVDSSINMASPPLFQAVAAGTVFPSASLTAATSSGGTLTDYAGWTFSNVSVTSYQTIDGAERYVLDYSKAELSYTPSSSNGGAGTPVDGSYDLAAHGGSVTTTTDLSPAGPTLTADYFLAIPGILGDSAAQGHVGAISVGSMSWGVTAGSVSAHASFAPLVVDSSINQASPLLFEAAAAGTVFPSVSLAAAKVVAGKLIEYANWTLRNAVVTSYRTANGAERYSLDYTKAELSYIPILSNGKSGTPVDASWDLAGQGGTTFPAAEKGPVGPAIAAEYFLAIPGVPGGSTAQAHEGAIEVGSMSWGVTAGSAAGNAAFAPFVVDSSINQASPFLFEAAAAGTVFPTVSLSAATSQNGILSDFAQWTLSNVVVTSYQTQDGAERYALAYTAAEMSYTPGSSDGASHFPVDASWDLAAQGGTMSKSANVAPAGQSVSAQYFLAIPGVAGSSGAQGHVGTIDVGSMSWGVTAGSVPGAPTFAALVVDSSISQASPLLFQAAAAGIVYSSVSLTAARFDGANLEDFAEWTFTNVMVTSYQTDDGSERYALNYTGVEFSYTPRSNGQSGAPVDTLWDLAAQGGTVAAAASPGPAGPIGNSVYFLAIPGIPGGSTAAGHVGAIDAESMSWGVTAGATSFAPLIIDASSSEASPFLFLAAASGTASSVVTLTAAAPIAGGLADYAKWTLSNVVVTNYQATDGVEEYALIFTKAEMTYTPTLADGSPGTPVDASFSYASPQVMLAAANQIYDNKPYSSAVVTVTGVAGSTPTLTYYGSSDTSLTNPLAGAPTDAGSYQVVASLAATAEYPAVQTEPVAFSITRAPLTIAADDQTKYYGNSGGSLTYHISAGTLFGSDQISGALVRAPGENVGTYAISQGTLTAGTNYTLSFQPGILAIIPATTGISLNSSTGVSVPGQYVTFTASVVVLSGGGTPTGSVAFTDGSVPLATVSLVGNVAIFTAPIGALGDHAITASFKPLGGNYSPPAAPAPFVQKVRPGALEIDPATGEYVLFVGGTPFNDMITISVNSGSKGKDQYRVQIDTKNGRTSTAFESQGTSDATIEKVVAYGMGTSDTINVICGPNVISELFGGPGVNVLRGGNGNNLLVGGAGVNALVGGPGRNILVAGKGLGVLTAGSGETILIAGSTAYDKPTSANLAAFDQIMAEWGSSDSAALREAYISGTASGGLNGTNVLNRSTVHDDALGDLVVGGSGLDWFFVDTSKNIVISKKGDKITNIRGW